MCITGTNNTSNAPVKRAINQSYEVTYDDMDKDSNLSAIRSALKVRLMEAFDVYVGTEANLPQRDSPSLPKLVLKRNSKSYGLGATGAFVASIPHGFEYDFLNAEGNTERVSIEPNKEVQFAFSVSLNPVRVVLPKGEASKIGREAALKKAAEHAAALAAAAKATTDAERKAKYTAICAAVQDAMTEAYFAVMGRDGVLPTGRLSKDNWGGMTKPEWVAECVTNGHVVTTPTLFAGTEYGNASFLIDDETGEVVPVMPELIQEVI